MNNGAAKRKEMQGTVLYADDDPVVLEISIQLLKGAGYRVLPAKDGAEALRLFSSEAVDAVVLDYQMPGLNGGAVASRIREIDHDIPLFLVSGVLDVPEVDLLLFNAFIPKSNSFPVLLSAIEKALASVKN